MEPFKFRGLNSASPANGNNW